MKLTRFGTIMLLTMAGVARTLEGEREIWVDVQGTTPESELESDPITGDTIARKGVLILHEAGRMRADEVVVRMPAGEVHAQGKVVLESGDDEQAQVLQAESVRYELESQRFMAEGFRLGQTPYFASGREVRGELEGVYTAEDVLLTTDDVTEPGYHVRARRMTLDPGNYMLVEGATFRAGSVPVFYLPWYRRNLREHSHYWTVLPGYRRVFGPFLQGAYHWNIQTNLQTALHLDWRERRGFGVGPAVQYDLGALGKGDALFYYAPDKDPTINAGDLPVRSDRRRIQFRHSYNNANGLSIKARVEEQNDPLVLRDFFEAEFRRDLQPRTFFEVHQSWENWTLGVLAQPQVNTFFQTIERLPELQVHGLRQQLGDTPLYYESQSSWGYLRFRQGLLGGTNYAGMRTDTYHQVVLPQTYFGWLNVLPRVGGRFSHYGDPEGLNTIDTDRSRWLFNTGSEVNFKASRTWADARNARLGIDGLRHIVQPSVNYVFVPAPDARPYELPQYDFDWATPRLLPIEFPDYNAVDAIDSQNVVRLALRNRLQTRRNGRAEDLVHWALYTDWRLKPRPDQETFSEVYSDMDLAPVSWMRMTSQLRYNVKDHAWREANHRVTLQPNDTWNWTLGHRYLVTDLNTYGLGNNLVYSSFYYRVNENWGMRATQHFETRDGVLEEQTYSVYRDLRSWTAMFGVRLRENRIGANDWALIFTMQLKAFPAWKLNDDRDLPERLFGG